MWVFIFWFIYVYKKILKLQQTNFNYRTWTFGKLRIGRHATVNRPFRSSILAGCISYSTDLKRLQRNLWKSNLVISEATQLLPVLQFTYPGTARLTTVWRSENSVRDPPPVCINLRNHDGWKYLFNLSLVELEYLSVRFFILCNVKYHKNSF